ncbi:DUF3383 family protein [Yersinia pekkanenii]|uniref:Protein of uncharacterized function (DUF3383) n=1 Tax=Yersinia pekkanenii TaxID=1288385 RepID=A0A0T9R7C7_9GAMM|nr:DUF3383 family protein [Yersinia pekkanenii]CNI48366.1 Protein of uncharacterised function (DUF3383) [Yersinia pekkanenii]CRY68212.1 Protein of uncharacterised function (DUF3383) [Yersinia pekkanenii]
MSIDMGKYVDIISGVGGGNSVRARELILRIFSRNNLISPDSILEFTSANNVLSYFGIESEEYKRAVKYFSYISPSIVQASKISFARDQAEMSDSLFLGVTVVYKIDKISQMSGTLSGDLDGIKFTTEEMSFENDQSLSSVAARIQGGISAAGYEYAPDMSQTSGFYNATSARFELTIQGENADIPVSVKLTIDPGEIADALGLSGGTAIMGIPAALTPVESVAAADDISNNYGSFLFIDDMELATSIDMAEANAAKNVMFIYLLGCTAANASAYYDALYSIASVGLTLIAATNTDFDEQIPGTLMAATNYDSRNSVINYMYRQIPGVTPKVTTTLLSDSYDKLRINYYGRTQTAGQKIDFYQRGTLMGGATAPVDMNVHANEQWLKDVCAAALLSLQLSLGRIPANISGQVQILTTLQESVNAALNNGVISVGKTLNINQKNYITQMTGDNQAWQQVQNIGYWIDAVMKETTTEDGRVEWQCVYTLIYSKDDVVRRVIGTHALI